MKQQTNQNHILFRYGVITILIILFSGMISYKLFSTTVIHADDWNKKAMTELQKVDTIFPERGEILSDDGSILATNLRFYTARLDFRAEKFMEERYRIALDSIADSLALHFPRRTKAEWFERLRKPLSTDPAKRPRAFLILKDISFADLQLLKTFPFFNIKNPTRNGLTVESRLRRKVPYGDMCRRSIGGVGQTEYSRAIHGTSGL